MPNNAYSIYILNAYFVRFGVYNIKFIIKLLKICKYFATFVKPVKVYSHYQIILNFLNEKIVLVIS